MSQAMEAEETPISPTVPEFQTMDESLEFIFMTMISQGEVLDAVEFIRSIDTGYLPSTTIMKTLIFEVLMKSDNVRALAYASNYLYTLIDVYSPINEERRKFYFDSVRADRGFLSDLWEVFSHIIRSHFIQHRIYEYERESSRTTPIRYPNSKFLLEIYLKLFTADFEDWKSDNSATCLMMMMLWPNSDVRTIQLSNRTADLLKWINDVYASHLVNDMINMLESLHEMLTLVVRCIIERKNELSESAAFSSAPLADIVDSIVNFCKDAFSNLSNVKIFLGFLPLKYLRAKLCERIIKQIIKVSSRKYSVLTLKDVVEQCMFPSKLPKLKNSNKPQLKEKKELRKRVDKKYFADMKMGKMETTKLHELCRKNKFADLLEELISSPNDINARDPLGNTPLHEACSVGSRMCVKHLIDEGCSGSSQALDFAAFNLEGLTPLHIAVMNNHIDIAKIILSYGGPELLTIPDSKGQLPTDLSTSDSMNKLLQEYEAKSKESNGKELVESDCSTEFKVKENHGPAPALKSFREYSIYLEALNCLLCTYCDMFNLYDYIWKKDTVVSSHNDKLCCHFIDKDACFEDTAIVLDLPSLIEPFMESISKNASKVELTIDIELIPLKGFAASLKTS